MIAPLLFLTIIGIGVAAYALGLANGHRDGYSSGYVRGKTAGIQQWQRVLEGKRQPEAELVAVYDDYPYDWAKEGL